MLSKFKTGNRKKVYKLNTKSRAPGLLLIIGILALILFAIVSWGVYVDSSWVNALDMTLIDAIQSQVSQGKTDLLIILTEVGNIRVAIGLTILLVLILFIKKWYAAGLWFGGTILVCAAVITKVLKKVFDRSRPDFMQLIEKTTESFPSGHATATTIFYGLLGLAIILLISTLWKRVIVGFITLALISFILVSRIYLGVHFPTDVIAGFLYGSGAVFISLGVYQLMAESLQTLLKKFKLNDQSETFSDHSIYIRRNY